MAQEEPNRLAEWLELVRRQWPIVRQHLRDWLDQVREEPRLIWETPTVRYATYGTGGLIIVWIILGFVHSITPPPPAAARPEATTADFHVVCARETCGHHFVIHREFGFRKFPVGCPACEQETGYQARRCYSPTCNGRWVIPSEGGGVLKCPYCGRDFPK